MIARHLYAYMKKFEEHKIEVIYNKEFTSTKEVSGNFNTCWIWIMRCEEAEEEKAEVEQMDLEGTPSENRLVKEIRGINKWSVINLLNNISLADRKKKAIKAKFAHVFVYWMPTNF